VEGFMEVGFYYENGNEISGTSFSLVKIGIILTCSVFYYPIYLIGIALNDDLVKISSLFLIVLTLISNINDIAIFYTNYMPVEVVLVVRSVMFGIGYILIGTAFVLRQKTLGTLSLVIGIFAIVSGLGFVSVLMAIPALFTLTIFEILLLVLIVKAMNTCGLSVGKGGKEFSAVVFLM
jgi:hypothetical protein